MLNSVIKVRESRKKVGDINIVPKQNFRPEQVDIPLHNFTKPIVIDNYEPVLTPEEVIIAKGKINLEIKELKKIIQSAEIKMNRVPLSQNIDLLEKSFNDFYKAIESIDNLLVHEDISSSLVPSEKDYLNKKVQIQENIYEKYID